ncbi:glutamate-5-semialdehyde dehydrogenase [Roseibium hamelinense]|uniref:Gamma-glutamyl phosphate reductase n=1 Tax=Roseibium hamelinense TaxID=150831 RepID=A0A562T0Q1_9HYPH|nr:glutamate-5-semialdehyde dehydrogenase [Roseibium hamelinense]MTI43783.1 glutamate-5-semialdehyde dehydrogenase [Roseibium hamelinense]TWI87137.1 glutamate-5-semialdehyde dehydrogenase [Roseibium hamelinense]
MLERAEISSISDVMRDLGSRARRAARVLATASPEVKDTALQAMADAIRASQAVILDGNRRDIDAMRAKGQTTAFLDRGTLDQGRINAIASALEDIKSLPDPVGSNMASWDRPNGLKISRVRTPLGVIGVIYESRPNVTADAGALCLKAGNAVILRGGSDTLHSNKAIHTALQQGVKEAGLPADAIQMVPVSDRAAVGEMLAGLDGNLDVIVPRGGKSLVGRIQSEARVPVFAHLEGLVHIFIDKAADPAKARDIVLNSKMRRTGICGAAETLLVHQDVAEMILPDVAQRLQEEGCEIRGDETTRRLVQHVVPATIDDWKTEYLDKILAVKTVPDLQSAMDHIAAFGSSHTDCIITEDPDAAERFLTEVDSAIVLHNASTQFADGGEFGMGAEIGIATGRMHARGPVGVEQLTSFKYQVRGEGQTRP